MKNPLPALVLGALVVLTTACATPGPAPAAPAPTTSFDRSLDDTTGEVTCKSYREGIVANPRDDLVLPVEEKPLVQKYCPEIEPKVRWI